MHIRGFMGIDFDPLAKLLGTLWHDHHGSRSYWQGADELCSHLSHTDKCFVAVDDANATLGAILLSGPREENGNDTLRMHWLQQRTRIGAMAAALGINARADANVLSEEDGLLEEVGDERGKGDAGVVVLLVLAEQARGKGIGKELLRQGLAWLDSCGATTVRLVTDDCCDWQFYEYLNMQRVAQKSFDVAGSELTAFVYESSTAGLLGRIS